ncbi:hypothetical protein SAMN04244574_03354 [Azotobacter beijerinckii]|uniref:Uncharacterized protein n=1 Tax=Azotobacter beijerinckii TaxID=170623 RepID=A0A1I4FFY5_9GAMM|nr:hypothetical protein SAMN04244571_03478 [Azotobacter beijerinckii]SFL16379.1 hypothetical protein SAMN04244574_03354 [Azotobacter beijerinckii]
MWDTILARFEKQAPASVMARLALERAMPATWVDDVFETNRQRQYPREQLFSTVVERMSLGCPGAAPFAACRRAPDGQPARIAGGAVRKGQAHRAPGADRFPAKPDRHST